MSNSPFRYPGGKTKLLPVLMEYIDNILFDQNIFIDAFVGGGSVILEVASKYPDIKLIANDKDVLIYSYWQVVSNSNTDDLNKLLQLLETKPTLELFYQLREDNSTDLVQRAYKALFFNRTTFSGIQYSGPIGGKDQNSKYTIDCRYNVKKLKEKTLACHKLLSGRTQVFNLDFSKLESLTKTQDPIYLDPPYYVKGDILYPEKMNGFQHEKLSEILSKRKKWVLSYDDCSTIRNLYKNNKIIDLSARYCINGKKDKWDAKNELIILGD